jgi:hypothetical protein
MILSLNYFLTLNSDFCSVNELGSQWNIVPINFLLLLCKERKINSLVFQWFFISSSLKGLRR